MKFVMFTAAVVAGSKPEQIHIALGPSPTSMAVQWSQETTSLTKVKYGPTADKLEWTADTAVYPFTDGGSEKHLNTHHVARMTSLSPSEEYFYKVGNKADGWSDVFSFSAAPTQETIKFPVRFGIWGDMGIANASAILSEVTDVIDNGKSFDMILHVGDFAYNMDNDNGHLGDHFMNDIQHIATKIPYMVDVGNHEVAYGFSHYTERFRLIGDSFAPRDYPTVSSSDGDGFNNWFYSHDYANVHFVAISTEIYFNYADTDLLKNQYDFIDADLKLVDRAKTPWVVVHGHRPCYCSCDDDCGDDAARTREGVDGKFGLEELLHKHNVDLYIAGHEHNYERMFDVYKNETTKTTTNPKETIHIITGDAGGPEGHEVFTLAQPERTAFRTDGFGYSEMTVYNDTHLHWQQFQGEDKNDKMFGNAAVIDQFWLVNENH